ncbi:DNA-binding protein, partial [Streptomyces anulatus]
MCAKQDDAGEAPHHGSGRERDTDGSDRFEVDEEVQHALDRLTLLINAAEALSSTLEVDQGLRRLCRTLVPGLADWCAVDLLDDRGRLRRVVVEHRDADVTSPGLDEGLLPPPEGSAASVARALLGVGPVLLTDFPPPQEGDDPLYRREKQL